MFDNVVVGIKDDETGRDALELARQLVSPNGRLLLVTVHDMVVWPFPVSDPNWQARERRRAMAELGPLREAAHVEAELLSVQARSVAGGLHEVVRRHGDLLTIGSRHPDEYDRAFIGDDAREVLEDPPAAVAVAPPGYAASARPLRTIGVAFDGSPGSEQALAVARELAHQRDAHLSAFGVVPEPLRIQHPLDMDREIEELVAEARDRLARLAEVETEVGYGDAAEQLSRYAASVDLIVLGPHVQRPIDRFMGGSTAQRFSDSAPCPFVVLSRRGRG